MLGIVFLSCVGRAIAGGGMILSKDACIVTIGFYTTHFTGYQPQSSDNTEFCREFPDVGETIIVLDYLHKSLSEVPVGVRIMRDVTGKGEFVQFEDVTAIGNLDESTVFYQAPVVKENATLIINPVFEDSGEYIAIITAGHPTNDKIYTAVIPFTVGVSKIPWAMLSLIAAIAIGGLYLLRMTGMGRTKTT